MLLKFRMRELKRFRKRPANDNWPGRPAEPAHRQAEDPEKLALVASGLLGLMIVSCLLGIGTVEFLVRW
jgi:hypothetical protein